MIIESLKYCQDNKGLDIYAYCIMPNHIHLIIGANGEYPLSAILRDFKKYTSRQIVKNIKEKPESRRDYFMQIIESEGKRQGRPQKHKVWKRGYRAYEISSNKFFDQKLDYIHNNPVKEMIVSNPEDYIFSSARNYAGMDSNLDVIVTKGRWKAY
ncbi:MAG: transposase [Bacteroidales bacterium]|nr:transposase [Bacteroidales bacterium]